MESLAVSQHESQLSNERLQAQDDLVTQFSELVNGSMYTEFTLKLEGHELYGRDGRSLKDISKKSLEEAEDLIKKNPNLWFERRRRGLEDEEVNEFTDMAEGKGPNTMVVISDFPSEL